MLAESLGAIGDRQEPWAEARALGASLEPLEPPGVCCGNRYNNPLCPSLSASAMDPRDYYLFIYCYICPAKKPV
jgi:hypothetical protein